jgi:YesN/AraC family two-component response regulator
MVSQDRPLERARVLVVDDDPGLLATLREWLVMEGCEVRVAADGLEALELARWEAFDVAVTDLKMPNLDGLGFVAALKGLAPEVKVIFLSGEATKADTIEALREGRSFDFLEKPLPSFDHLSRAIARALAARPLTPVPETPVPAVNGAGHPLIERVFSYLHGHLHEPIGLRDVAAALGYSGSYLTALVRQETGQPVGQWITTLRMERAQQLLREPHRSIAAVAEAVGVADAKYFSRQFKKVCGETPQAFRDRTGAG